MLRRILKFALAAIAMTQFSPTIAAQELNRTEIERMERELTYKWAKLEKLNIVTGRYQEAYQTFFGNESSFVAQYEAFNQASVRWLNEWERLFTTFGLRDSIDTSSISRLSATLKAKLDDQARAYTELEKQAIKLQTAADLFSERLSRIGVLYASNFDPPFAPYIEQINRDLNSLKHANDALVPAINQRLQELDDFVSQAEKLITQALRQQLLSEASLPLEEAVRVIEGLFAVDRLGTRYFEKARVSFNKIQFYEFRFLQFHAERELAKLGHIVSDFRQIVKDRNDLPGFYMNDYLRSLEDYYADAKARVEGLNAYPAYENLYYAIQEMRDLYLKEIKSKGLICNQRLLKNLAALTEEKLKGLSREELKEIEFLWDDVGPLAR